METQRKMEQLLSHFLRTYGLIKAIRNFLGG